MTTTLDPSPAQFDEEPLHWPGTAGAQVVATNPLRETRAAITTLIDNGGVVIVDGDPGLGKTFATHMAVKDCNRDVLWISMPDHPRGKETTARINQALTGRMPKMRQQTEYELLEENLDLLRNRSTALVVDEAQHLPTGSLRQLRYLFDQPSVNLLLVLVGVNVTSLVQQRCPELGNRVSRVVRFGELSGAQTREAVRQYHPLFALADADALELLFDVAGGRFRNWAKLLEAGLAAGLEQELSRGDAALLCRAVYGQSATTRRRRSTMGTAA